MTAIPFSGRVLYLCDDPGKLGAQLAGQDLAADEVGLLRHDVSTDEITPNPSLTFHDERLGQYVYTGFKAGTAMPIGVGAIRKGGFSIAVAGRRYGKGSSREHSPAAEL